MTILAISGYTMIFLSRFCSFINAIEQQYVSGRYSKILYKVGYELQLAPITNSADREYTSRFGKLLRDEWIMTSYKPRFSLSDQGQSLFRKLHIAYVETVQPMRASKIPNNCYMTWLICYPKDINYNILSCLNINIMFCFGKYLQRGLHCFCYWFRLQPEGEELGGGMRSR